MSEQGINLAEREPYPEDPYELLMTQRLRHTGESSQIITEDVRERLMALRILPII